MARRFLYRLALAFFVSIPVVAILFLLGVPVSGGGLYAGLFGGVALSYVPEALAGMIFKAVS